MNKDVRANQFRENFASTRDEPHQRYSRITVRRMSTEDGSRSR